MTIRIGIVGYGNLGRGVETAISAQADLSLTGIFTRRDPVTFDPLSDAPVYSLSDIDAHADDIDVLVLCGGSASDLPVQSPELAKRFSLVDSFDNHAHIPEHFAAVDQAATEGGTTAVISTGWDPGLFSLNRLYGEAILPQGETYTFWGRGISQGHSDALRRIPGVAGAAQYTQPAEDAIERVRSITSSPTTPRSTSSRQKNLLETTRACLTVGS